MAKLWNYEQNPGAFISDPTVRGGICMAMSYYVMKRCLARLETTPALLDRKLGLFTSMQRAHKWDIKLSSVEWVKMLSKGDNLKAEVKNYSENLDEVFRQAFGAMQDAMSQGSTCCGLYLSLKWNNAGHGIMMAVDAQEKSINFFDPNLGFYSLKNEDDFKLFDSEFTRTYPHPGKVGCVVVFGVPRDLGSLSSD